MPTSAISFEVVNWRHVDNDKLILENTLATYLSVKSNFLKRPSISKNNKLKLKLQMKIYWFILKSGEFTKQLLTQVLKSHIIISKKLENNTFTDKATYKKV